MWILILFAHVGALGNGNSNSITTAEYTSQQRCSQALGLAKDLTSGSTKTITGICTQK